MPSDKPDIFLVIVLPAIVSFIVALATTLIQNKLQKRNDSQIFIREKEYDTHEKIYNFLDISLSKDQLSPLLTHLDLPEIGFDKFQDQFSLITQGMNGLIYSEILFLIKNFKERLQDIEKISKRSNRNIRKIASQIIEMYDSNKESVQETADDIGYGIAETNGWSKNQIDYCEYETVRLFSKRILPLLIEFKKELKKYVYV